MLSPNLPTWYHTNRAAINEPGSEMARMFHLLYETRLVALDF